MEKEELLKQIGDNYTVCFLEDCPSKGDCVHHLIYERLPEHVQERRCVLPQARRGDTCPCYVPFRVERKAWGMQKSYDHVRKEDLDALRWRVMCYLGGKSSYYRYYRGEKLLSEAQQEEIASFFRAKGYETDQLFDHYVDACNS